MDLEELINILQGLHDDVDFEDNEELVDSGLLDSFDIITLIAEIDSHFGVTIPAEEIIPENFNSVKALYALIQRLTDEG